MTNGFDEFDYSSFYFVDIFYYSVKKFGRKSTVFNNFTKALINR